MAAVHNPTSLSAPSATPPTDSSTPSVAKRERNIATDPMLNDFHPFPPHLPTALHSAIPSYSYHHNQSPHQQLHNTSSQSHHHTSPTTSTPLSAPSQTTPPAPSNSTSQPSTSTLPAQSNHLPHTSAPQHSHPSLHHHSHQGQQHQHHPHLPLPLNHSQHSDRNTATSSQSHLPLPSTSAAKLTSQHLSGVPPLENPSLPHPHHQSSNLLQHSPNLPHAQIPSHSAAHQSLQPILQSQTHQPPLLPALNQNHFKHTDEVDVADELISIVPSSGGRSQDIHSALVSSTFPHDQLQHTPVHSVIDSILPPDTENDPLNIGVNIPMPLQLDTQRHIIVSDPDSTTRPPLSQSFLQTQPSPLQASTPSFLQVPHTMSQLPYSTHAVPHSQVLLQASSSVTPFSMAMHPRGQMDGTTNLLYGRNANRGFSTPQGMLMNPPEDSQRRGLASNQISIQDLTKTKSEPSEAVQEHYSPASPSFSAVTISPPALVQPPQPSVAPLPSTSVSSVRGGESPTSVATNPGLICPICKSVFTRRYNLKVHLSSKHSARRDYTCPHCPNAFNRVDSLKRHVATTHRGEKKWKCNYCKRSFGQRPHMKMHIDTVHLKKRDHKCHCGKAFGTRYNLTAHQRTHEQTPKKHVCLVCKKSFALKSSLARHQRNSGHTPDVNPIVPPIDTNIPGMPNVNGTSS